MAPPSYIPELAAPQGASTKAQEFARCLERAAALVENFAGQSAPAALDALLALAAQPGPGPRAKRALSLARTVTKQAQTLDEEVARFLALAQDR